MQLRGPAVAVNRCRRCRNVCYALYHQLNGLCNPTSHLALDCSVAFLTLLSVTLSRTSPQFYPNQYDFGPAGQYTGTGGAHTVSQTTRVNAVLDCCGLQSALTSRNFNGQLNTQLTLLFTTPTRGQTGGRQPSASHTITSVVITRATLRTRGTTSVSQTTRPFTVLLRTLTTSMTGSSGRQRVLSHFNCYLKQ